MEMIDRIIEQREVFIEEEIRDATVKLRKEIESFSRQLDRLIKMETFLKEK